MTNSLPKAQDISVAILEDQVATIILNGSDTDGSITAYKLASLPANGTLFVDASLTQQAITGFLYSSATFYFLPGTNFNGASSFQYSAVDDQGGTSRSNATAIVRVAPVNDAPIVDLAGAAAQYVIGGSAVRVAPAASVADVDSTNFNGGLLRIAVVEGGTATDQLGVSADSTVVLSTRGVFVAGVKVGTVQTGHTGANGSDLRIDLVKGATSQSISTLLQHITYANASAVELPSTRAIAVEMTDGAGVGGGMSTAMTSVNLRPDSPPTGTVSIGGLAREDQILTASNTLADADGVGPISYQWQRDVGSGYVDLAGATGATFRLRDADVGATLRVVARYRDGAGVVESVASTGIGTVSNVNDPPKGKLTITGPAIEGQVLLASSTLSDADGMGLISWQWKRDTGAGFKKIDGATGSTYTLVDADVGTTITVVASYIDGYGTAESVPSAAVGPVANVNDSPSGSVSIAGIASEDQLLTASNARGGRGWAGNDQLPVAARRCRHRGRHSQHLPAGRRRRGRQHHGRWRATPTCTARRST
jgi:hypothetical protein